MASDLDRVVLRQQLDELSCHRYDEGRRAPSILGAAHRTRTSAKGRHHGRTATRTPVLDLLASMTADSVEASSLDPATLMLVRIAALAAVDATPVSYLLNLQAAGELDLDAEQVRGVLVAIADRNRPCRRRSGEDHRRFRDRYRDRGARGGDHRRRSTMSATSVKSPSPARPCTRSRPTGSRQTRDARVRGRRSQSRDVRCRHDHLDFTHGPEVFLNGFPGASRAALPKDFHDAGRKQRS